MQQRQHCSSPDSLFVAESFFFGLRRRPSFPSFLIFRTKPKKKKSPNLSLASIDDHDGSVVPYGRRHIAHETLELFSYLRPVLTGVDSTGDVRN